MLQSSFRIEARNPGNDDALPLSRRERHCQARIPVRVRVISHGGVMAARRHGASATEVPWATALSPLGGRPSRSPGRPPVRRPADRRKPWVERRALIPTPGRQPPKRGVAFAGRTEWPRRRPRSGAENRGGKTGGRLDPRAPFGRSGLRLGSPPFGGFRRSSEEGARIRGCEDPGPQGPCATVGDYTHPSGNLPKL